VQITHPRDRNNLIHSISVETIVRPLVWLGAILLVLWAVAWLGLKVLNGAVHLLLVIGVIMLIWGLVSRGARAVAGGRHSP
jgi:uncharacterized membrane protein (DUF485 family)